MTDAKGSALRAFTLRLMRGENLLQTEAAEFLAALLDNAATDAQIAAALMALALKGETVEELAGLAAAMRARAVRIQSQHAVFVDTAGTGSSTSKTFNVSTAAAFVIAGAGLPVAKHGSRAVTSRSGSADVLSALGVNVSVSPAVAERCLNELGICFLFAPDYHGSTARVAGIRRELGVRTTFNLLGPLTNPAGATRQVLGVFHANLVEPMARALCLLGAEWAWVVHGTDGLDEVTVNGATLVAEARAGQVKLFSIGPADFGLEPSDLSAVPRSDAGASALLISEILAGRRRDALRSVVIANAAVALLVGDKADSLRAAALMAAESIDSGAALSKLTALASDAPLGDLT